MWVRCLKNEGFKISRFKWIYILVIKELGRSYGLWIRVCGIKVEGIFS